MVKDKKDGGLGNAVVTRSFCDERTERGMDQINSLKEDIADAKKATIDKSDELKKEIQKLKSDKEEEEKERSHFWRNLLGTVAGGALVAVIGFLVSRIHF